MRNKRRGERHENSTEKVNWRAGEGATGILGIREQHSACRNAFLLAFWKKTSQKTRSTLVFPSSSVQVLILLYYSINTIGISESYLRRHVHKNKHCWYLLTSADFQRLTESNKIKHATQFTKVEQLQRSPQDNLRWKCIKDAPQSRNPSRAIKHHTQNSHPALATAGNDSG